MKYSLIIVLGLAVLMSGCVMQSEQSYYRQINMPHDLNDRSRLMTWLYASEVLNKERSLVHLSHVCNLVIDTHEYPVINVRELVQGAITARGINRIVVLNNGYQLVKSIEYANTFPLFCEGSMLYVYGDLTVTGISGSGNVIKFEDGGYQLSLVKEDINGKLPLKIK